MPRPGRPTGSGCASSRRRRPRPTRSPTSSAARIAAKRDALVEALTQAYGLGGRVRRTGSAAERARTAVTARIKDAIRRIGDVHPELGRHLTRSVRTGTFCVYDPDQPTRWTG